MNAKKRLYSAVWLTACLLSTAGATYAIGLGEINIHSALGQPLQASIALLGEKNLSADCIKFQASSDYGLPMPPTLKLELKETAGKPPRLWLSTSQAMHEPALGFTVILQCDGRLQREYAILLDPAPPTPHEEVAPSVPMLAATTKPVTTEPTAAEPTRHVAANRSLAAAVSGNNIAPTRNPPKPSGRATPRQPRLTLSGSRMLMTNSEFGLPLKLDFTLPDPERIPDKPLSETERLDDNIALTHKLAHLEQQLVSLQKRNEELTRRAAPTQTLARTTAQATESPFHSLPQWIYILAGMLLLSGAVAWVLSRRRHTLGEYDEDDYVIVASPQHDPLFMANSTLEPIERASPQPVPKPQTQNILNKGTTAKTESAESRRPEEMADTHLNLADSEPQNQPGSVVEVSLTQDDLSLAIQLLEEGIQQNPQANPASWLTLLDFLQRVGDTARYVQVRDKFKQLFNMNIPDPTHAQLAQGRVGLESYPHVLSELLRLWPTTNTAPYLESLLRDTRGGTRTGFDLQSFQEIHFLLDILKFGGIPVDSTALGFSDIRNMR